MWTAQIKEKRLIGDKVSILVAIGNGKETFDETFILSNAQSPEWIKQRVNEKIKILTDLLDYKDSISEGALDLTPEVLPTPDPPTKEDTDRQAFSEEFNKLQKLQKAFDAGLIKQDDVTTQAVVVKELYKPEFIDIVSE